MPGGYRLGALVAEDPLGPIHEARDLDGGLFHALMVRAEFDPQRESVLEWAASLARMPSHPRVQHRIDLIDRDSLVVVLRAIGGVVLGPSSERPLHHLADVARGLAHAHRHGVVHGSLTGEMVRQVGGAAFVTRFGSAHLARSLNQTRAGGYVARHVHALAPELARPGATPTPASDVYALGVLAYEWLSGRVPFAEHTSGVAILMATMSQPVPPLVGDGEVGRVVHAMLAKDPKERPTAEQVALRLDPALEWPLL